MRCLATVKRMTSCTRRSLLCCSAIMAQVFFRFSDPMNHPLFNTKRIWNSIVNHLISDPFFELLLVFFVGTQRSTTASVCSPFRRMYRNLRLRMMGTIIRPRRSRPRLSDFGMGQFSHVQPGTLMYPDVPCTLSWCGCSSWENPRRSASLFTMFDPSHLVCPMMSQFC